MFGIADHGAFLATVLPHTALSGSRNLALFASANPAGLRARTAGVTSVLLIVGWRAARG